MENNNKEQLEKVGNIANKIINRFETGIASVAIISFILMTRQIEIGNPIFIIALSLLSTFYFLMAFRKNDDPIATGIEIFLLKLYCWSMSLIVVGILFSMNRWPLWNNNLIVSSAALFLSTIFIFYLKNKKPELTIFNSRTIIRALIILIIGAFLLFTPTDRLSRYGIIKNPENIDQIKK